MMRKLVTAAVAVAAATSVLVGVAGVASAAPAPMQLVIGQSQAFAILGASCGGIQEAVTTNGFGPSTGYPTGVVQMKTSCGGSGKGGGYHSTTYTATADVVWDLTAAVVSTSAPATGAVTDPSYSAFDTSGNEVYNSGTSAFLLLAPTYVPVPRVTGDSVTEGPAAGTVDVTVTSAGGTDQTGPFDLFSFVAAPTVTSLSPSSGPLNGGNLIVVSGTGLAAVTSVDIGGSYAAVEAQDDTSITVIAPAGESVDNSSLRVTSVGGTASAAYAYTAPDLCGTGCMFTSPATASAFANVPFSFTVSASGYVIPSFTEKGKLPKGVTFVENYDGSATLSGTPVVVGRRAPAGTYRAKVTATFAYGTAVKRIIQQVVLTVS